MNTARLKIPAFLTGFARSPERLAGLAGAQQIHRTHMTSIRLSQLYALEDRTIDSAVCEKSPGVYALDRSSKGWFTVTYVGRSDHDVNASLHGHVGQYRFFKFAYVSSPEIAFEEECELYHDYLPADNVGHPRSQSGLKCPRCEFTG